MSQKPRRALGMQYVAPEQNEGAKYKRATNIALLGLAIVVLGGLYFWLLPPKKVPETHFFIWQQANFDFPEKVLPLVACNDSQLIQIKTLADTYGWKFDENKNNLTAKGQDAAATSVEALTAGIKNLNPEDTIIIYYRGYIFLEGDSSDNNSLTPHIMAQNYDPKSSNAQNTSINLFEVLKKLESSDCGKVVLLLDWADPELAPKYLVNKKKKDYAVLASLNEKTKDFSKVRIISAKQDHQPSLCKWKVEKEEAETLFFHSLKTLADETRKDTNRTESQLISFQAFFDRLEKSLLEKSNGLQTPQRMGNNDNDFDIARLKATSSSETATSTIPPNPSTPATAKPVESIALTPYYPEKDLQKRWEDNWVDYSFTTPIDPSKLDPIAVAPQQYRTNIENLRHAEFGQRLGRPISLTSPDSRLSDLLLQISSDIPFVRPWFFDGKDELKRQIQLDYQYKPNPQLSFEATRDFVRCFARLGVHHLEWNQLHAFYPSGPLQDAISLHLNQLNKADLLWQELETDASTVDRSEKETQVSELTNSFKQVRQAIEKEIEAFQNSTCTIWEFHYRAHMLLSYADLSIEQRWKIWSILKAGPKPSFTGVSQSPNLGQEFLELSDASKWLSKINKDEKFSAIVAPTKSNELELSWSRPDASVVVNELNRSEKLTILVQCRNGEPPPARVNLVWSKKENPTAPLSLEGFPADKPSFSASVVKGKIDLSIIATEFSENQPTATWEFALAEYPQQKVVARISPPVVSKLIVSAKASNNGSATTIPTEMVDGEWSVLSLPVSTLAGKDGSSAESKFDLYIENPSRIARELKIEIFRISSIPNTPDFQLRKGSFLWRFPQVSQKLALRPEDLLEVIRRSETDKRPLQSTKINLPAEANQQISFETTPPSNAPPAENQNTPADIVAADKGLLLCITDEKDPATAPQLIPIFFQSYFPFEALENVNGIRPEFSFDGKSKILSVQLKNIEALWRYCDLKANGIESIRLFADLQETSQNPAFEQTKTLEIIPAKPEAKIEFQLSDSQIENGVYVNIGFSRFRRQASYIWRKDDDSLVREKETKTAAFFSDIPVIFGPSTPTAGDKAAAAEPPPFALRPMLETRNRYILIGSRSADLDEWKRNARVEIPINTVFPSNDEMLYWRLLSPQDQPLADGVVPAQLDESFNVQIEKSGTLIGRSTLKPLSVSFPLRQIRKDDSSDDGVYSLELYVDKVINSFRQASDNPRTPADMFGEESTKKDIVEINVDTKAPESGKKIVFANASTKSIELGKDVNFSIKILDPGTNSTGIKTIRIGRDGLNGGTPDSSFQEIETLELTANRNPDEKRKDEWTFTHKFEKNEGKIRLVAQVIDHAGNVQENVFSDLLSMSAPVSEKKKTYNVTVSVIMKATGEAPSTGGDVTIEGVGAQAFEGGKGIASFDGVQPGDYKIAATSDDYVGEASLSVKGSKSAVSVVVELQRKKK